MGRMPLGWLPRLCQSFSSSLSYSLRPILGARADERRALFHVSRILIYGSLHSLASELLLLFLVVYTRMVTQQ